METNVHYTIVGIFVISLVSAFILGVIWLSSGFKFEHVTTFQVNMKESVSGLDVDSPVEFNGVSVGSVKSIDLDHDNPRLVVLLLDIKSGTPVTEGTVATLKTRGITGINYVALSDNSMDLTPLVVQPGQEYPIITTGPSLFLRLDTALSALSENFQKVAKAVDSLLDQQNQREFKELLINLRKTSIEMAPLIKASTATMKATTSTMNMLENQTLPRTYQMLNSLEQATQNLNQITNQVKQNPSILIRGVDKPALGPGER